MRQFIPGLYHSQIASESVWVVVVGDQLLFDGDQFLFSESQARDRCTAVADIELKVGQLQQAGRWLDCFCLVMADLPDAQGCVVDVGCLRGLREMLMRAEEADFLLAGAAVQLGSWYRDHRYCGRCGQTTRMRDDDRAMYCQACNHRQYPRLSPCVLMLVTRGPECLLAVHKRSKVPMHTALAGFVEAGESLEGAVVREVEEEVGIRVASCEYVASQPWPFPGQLMIGYCAEALPDQDALTLQDQELSEAAWYRYDQIPSLIPPSQTLSGQLIRAFIDRCKMQYE